MLLASIKIRLFEKQYQLPKISVHLKRLKFPQYEIS